MKKWLILAIAISFLAFPLTSLAQMGQMSPKSKDINVEFFGSLKTFPHFMNNVDFNKDSTATGWDFIVDENGAMADHSIRNELRIGWKGKGKNWDFLIILESEFNLSKANGDRGQDTTLGRPTSGLGGILGGGLDDFGMSGEDFGVEKLHVSYDFGPLAVFTGWNTKFLDLMTGGLVYGDDHPYMGLSGKVGSSFTWEFLYLIIQDDIDWGAGGGTIMDGDTLDWRVYSLKGKYKMPNGFIISPFYAFSDNSETQSWDAKVHYFGLELYGKLGLLTPRLEIAYANGDTGETAAGMDYDIDAMAWFASVDINISPKFTPYLGVRWLSGDSDDNDTDIDAWNGVTDIARYTPTFGMENAFHYRFAWMLGSHLYSGTFDMMTNGATRGYGGISNSGQGSAPGLVMYGLGFKGAMGKFSYKAQFLHFDFEDTGGMEDGTGIASIDDEVGQEYDVRLAYKFSNHFTMANTFSAFDPGEGLQDRWAAVGDTDKTAILNTLEFIWSW